MPSPKPTIADVYKFIQQHGSDVSTADFSSKTLPIAQKLGLTFNKSGKVNARSLTQFTATPPPRHVARSQAAKLAEQKAVAHEEFKAFRPEGELPTAGMKGYMNPELTSAQSLRNRLIGEGTFSAAPTPGTMRGTMGTLGGSEPMFYNPGGGNVTSGVNMPIPGNRIAAEAREVAHLRPPGPPVGGGPSTRIGNVPLGAEPPVGLPTPTPGPASAAEALATSSPRSYGGIPAGEPVPVARAGGLFGEAEAAAAARAPGALGPPSFGGVPIPESAVGAGRLGQQTPGLGGIGTEGVPMSLEGAGTVPAAAEGGLLKRGLGGYKKFLGVKAPVEGEEAASGILSRFGRAASGSEGFGAKLGAYGIGGLAAGMAAPVVGGYLGGGDEDVAGKLGRADVGQFAQGALSAVGMVAPFAPFTGPAAPYVVGLAGLAGGIYSALQGTDEGQDPTEVFAKTRKMFKDAGQEWDAADQKQAYLNYSMLIDSGQPPDEAKRLVVTDIMQRLQAKQQSDEMQQRQNAYNSNMSTIQLALMSQQQKAMAEQSQKYDVYANNAINAGNAAIDQSGMSPTDIAFLKAQQADALRSMQAVQAATNQAYTMQPSVDMMQQYYDQQRGLGDQYSQMVNARQLSSMVPQTSGNTGGPDLASLLGQQSNQFQPTG